MKAKKKSVIPKQTEVNIRVQWSLNEHWDTILLSACYLLQNIFNAFSTTSCYCLQICTDNVFHENWYAMFTSLCSFHTLPVSSDYSKSWQIAAHNIATWHFLSTTQEWPLGRWFLCLTTVTFKSSAPITLKLHLACPMTQPKKSILMYRQISVEVSDYYSQ